MTIKLIEDLTLIVGLALRNSYINYIDYIMHLWDVYVDKTFNRPFCWYCLTMRWIEKKRTESEKDYLIRTEQLMKKEKDLLDENDKNKNWWRGKAN